jgi:Zn-finger nucleic acid-binding protein
VTDPYREPAKPTIPCPRCAVGLGTRRVLDASIDECATCDGAFVANALVPRLLDPVDLGMEVIATFPDGVPPEHDVRYLACPRCAGLMNRRTLIRGSNIVVDHCKRHGFWFDAYELRRLADLAASGSQPLPGPTASEPARVAQVDYSLLDVDREPGMIERIVDFINQRLGR